MWNRQQWTVGSLYGQPQGAQPAPVPEPAPAAGSAVACDYPPNTLRAETDCLRSGYPIHRSNVFEN
jgi:hypothetical protein